MNIEDIDFEEHTIRILGKGDKIRMVFVDEETLGDIRKFIGNKIVGPLFVGQQGKHIFTPGDPAYFQELRTVGNYPA